MGELNDFSKITRLTPQQEGMLIQYISDAHSGLHVMRARRKLQGKFNENFFRKACDAVLRKYPSLRTSFQLLNSSYSAILIDNQKISISFQDVSLLSPVEFEKTMAAYIEADRHEGFDLSNAPLMRIKIFRTSDLSHEMICTFHHIIADAATVDLVLQDLEIAYGQASDKQDIRIGVSTSYADFSLWLSQQDFSAAKNFWTQELKGFRSANLFPIIKPEIQNLQISRKSAQVYISSIESEPLFQFCETYGVSVNRLFQAAWAVLISRYSSEDEVVFGNAVAVRPKEISQSETIAGLCINTVPFRVVIQPEMPVTQWLQSIEKKWKVQVPFIQCPFSTIKSTSEVPHGAPLFFSILNIHRNSKPRLVSKTDCLFHSVHTTSDRGSAWNEHPLTLNIINESGFTLRLDYDNTVITTQAAGRLVSHLKVLLQNLVENPSCPVGKLNILTSKEKDELLLFSRGRVLDYKDAKASLHQLIERQVLKSPDAVALKFQDQILTYAELNHKANQVAHFLRAEGVKENSLVSICMNRSLEMVIGLLGIMKSGGAYVPIDPEYPGDRISFMVEDLSPKIILTQKLLLPVLNSNSKKIALDSEWSKIEAFPFENLQNVNSPTDLAYGIYTSGSTGKPKCALNTHEGIVNRLLWMQKEYQLTENDVVLQKTPFSFDVSVWEFFWPLMTGSKLVIAKPGGHRDPAYLIDFIDEEKVTVLHFVPSMLQAFLTVAEKYRCQSLRQVVCSGEALPKDLVERFFQNFDCRLHNLYGPTEAAVDVSYWECGYEGDRKTIPIGKPIDNIQLVVLDKFQNLQPVGIPGELHIGGVGLAKKYWNRQQLTIEKFIQNPIAAVPSPRLYRTGDLTKFAEDGQIEYLGRIDFQVKIRGQRVELGEIEASICEHPAIYEAVVVAHQSAPGDMMLLAYVVSSDKLLTSQMLRDYLSVKLPQYMVPSALVFLEALPSSPNGKVDRKALPKITLETSTQQTNYQAPLTDTAQLIGSIWQDILGCGPVGLNDNYFSMGGDSLHAIKIAVAGKKLGLLLSPLDILKYQTINDISKHAKKAAFDSQKESSIPFHLLESRDNLAPPLGEDFADVFQASRMQIYQLNEYNADQNRDGIYHYQKTLVVEDEMLSIQHLKKALFFTLSKQDIFKTHFIKSKSGKTYLAVRKKLSDELIKNSYSEENISHLDLDSQKNYIAKAVLGDRMAGFNTESLESLPYRIVVFRTSQKSCEVLFAFHHAICDGWGKVEFFNELFDMYSLMKTGKNPSLVTAKNVFKEFVALEQEAIQSDDHRAFWSTAMNETKPVKLPPIKSTFPASEDFSIGLMGSKQFNALSQKLKVSVKALYLSAFYDALLPYFEKSQIPVIGVVSNGRSERLSDPLKAFGLFWNILPIPCKPEESSKKNVQVTDVQRMLIQSDQFSHYPLASIQEDVGIKELFFASFNFIYFHNSRATDSSHYDFKVKSGDLLDRWSFPLNLTVVVHPFNNTTSLRIAYSTNYFTLKMVEGITQRMLSSLDSYLKINFESEQPKKKLAS